jgi:hypothetical protein
MDQRRTPDDLETAALEPDEALLARFLGSDVPPAPVAAMWDDIRSRLPIEAPPRARLLRLGAVVAAAAAAVLLVATILFVSGDDASAPRLRLQVIDVPETDEPMDLSREEAAEIFFGSEAPVLLGSDLASDTTGGGG